MLLPFTVAVPWLYTMAPGVSAANIDSGKIALSVPARIFSTVPTLATLPSSGDDLYAQIQCYASESYLPVPCRSMPFEARKCLSGGKLRREHVIHVPLCFGSAPAFDGIPPDKAEPFIQADLGPLPMSPPANSEL